MSRPPSARVTTWPLSSEAEREHWDAWAAAISAARHPSLARVEEVSRTEDLGTLVLADPDSESVTEWAERTGASVPERLGVLRAAAAALDALYAGSDNAPGVPHGGVSAAALRVTSDGAARIVGFSPWVTADNEMFRAPEVSAGAVGTRAADAFAFARLVANVLGGPKVAGATDVPGLSQALRSSPDTRRRVRLIKAIVSALTDPPEVRPHPLTSWLAAAVEGTAATEVTGQRVPAAERSGGRLQHPDRAPGRRILVTSAALAAAAAVIVAIVWSAHRDNEPQHEPSQPPAGATTGTSLIKATTNWAPACGDDSGVAADDDLVDLRRPEDASELEAAATVVAGGRWHRGRALISLASGSTTEDVVISDVRAVLVRPANQPAWVARPSPDCSVGKQPEASWAADLDAGTTTLVDGGRPDRFTRGRFVLRPTPTLIAIDVSTCHNYLWRPVITYGIGPQKGVLRLKPLYVYGSGTGIEQWQLGSGRSAAKRLVGDDLTGADPACPEVD